MIRAMRGQGSGNDQDSGSDARMWADALRMSSVGLALVLTIGVAAGIGYLLDRHFATAPWLMVTGFGVGVVGGFIELFREARRIQRDYDRG
jgi:F0F1-type ATP synthase assembly protein I